MKKLSEIGQAMYGTKSFVESPDPEEFFGALFAWKQGHDVYTHQVHVLTPAERRELVFLAWNTAWRAAIRAFEEYEYREGGHTGDGDAEFYEWLKEQGL